MRESEPLWAAYLNTDYLADTPLGSLQIRIGEPVPVLDELLRQVGLAEWSFVTAHNPASIPLDEHENQLRHDELCAWVREFEFPYFEGFGVGRDNDWPPERSVLVLGLPLATAIELGQRFGQNAIVAGWVGEPAHLVDCRRSSTREG